MVVVVVVAVVVVVVVVWWCVCESVRVVSPKGGCDGH